MFKRRCFVIECFLLFVVLFLAGGRHCLAESRKLEPAKDTFIDQWAPAAAKGNNPALVIRRTSLPDFALETLIQFDLSGIPAGAKVNSATLNLYYFHWYDWDPDGNPLEVHRLTQDWPESTTTWNNQPSFDAAVSASTNAPASFGWIQWNVTGDVQAFIDGGKPNYGWKIKDVSDYANAMIYCRSREYSDSVYRPFLQLDVDTEPCGGNGYHPGDLNKDCVVNLGDLLIIAQNWLLCSDASDPTCIVPLQNKVVGAGFAFDGDSAGPAKILFLYDTMNEGMIGPEDEIVEYNNIPVSSGTQLREIIKTMPDPLPGTSMPVTVLRQGSLTNVTVQNNYIRRVDFRQYVHPYRYTKTSNASCVTSYLSNGKRYCYCQSSAYSTDCYEKNLYCTDPDSPNIYLIVSECFDKLPVVNGAINGSCYSFNPDNFKLFPGSVRGLTSIVGK